MICFIADIENISRKSLKKWEEVLSVAEKKRLSEMPSLKRRREFILGRALIKKQCAAYFEKMLHRGIYLAPAQFEAMFVSYAHSAADLDETSQAARNVFAQL